MTQPTKEPVFLAVDLGASSSRVMAGFESAETGKLILEEVHRFPSSAIQIDESLHWDILEIFNSIKQGLKLAALKYGDRIVSVGVDSWGVDYALVDGDGSMLQNPFHYRDSRTDGMEVAVQNIVSKEDIYAETGIQFLFFNTIYQLYSELRNHFEPSAQRLLFIPDLISYWLSGSVHQERTIASTSQLLNPTTGTWSKKLLEALEIPSGIFLPVVEPGTVVGVARPDIEKKTGLQGLSVVAVAGHDTASAFIALPGNRKDYAIMSSGTWSLMGLELSEPCLGKDALSDGFSNEVGYGKTIRFLKNICGMWLVEECLRSWATQGHTYNYDEVVQMAEEAPPFVSLIDPDAPEFAAPEDMPKSISDYCERTGQPVPTDHGALLRCIFDSLVLKYRFVFKKLESYSPQPIRGLYVLGGGSRNGLLNQMTADALGVPVITGPAEATAVGNVAVQMIASGGLSGLEESRELVSRSFISENFEPADTGLYEQAIDRFDKLLG